MNMLNNVTKLSHHLMDVFIILWKSLTCKCSQVLSCIQLVIQGHYNVYIVSQIRVENSKMLSYFVSQSQYGFSRLSHLNLLYSRSE